MNCVQKTNAEVNAALHNKQFWISIASISAIAGGIIAEVMGLTFLMVRFWPGLSGIALVIAFISMITIILVQALYAILLFTNCQTSLTADNGSNNEFGG